MKNLLLSTIVILAFVSHTQAQMANRKIEKGNLISFIAAHYHSPETQQMAMNEYFPKVMPLAQKYSFQPLITFNNVQVKNQHFMAGGFGLYRWNSEQDFVNFHKEAYWPEIQSTRPKYWKCFRSVHIRTTVDRTLTFKADKHYTIAYTWLNEFANANERHSNYLKQMASVIQRIGGKEVYAVESKDIRSMSSLDNDRKPDRISILEWPSSTSYNKYINSPEYKNLQSEFSNVVAEFESFNATANFPDQ